MRSPARTAPSGAHLRLRIASLAPGGDAVAHVEEAGERRAVFLARGAPGDLVDARVDLARRPARGEIEAIVEPSPGRVAPPCAEYAACGGCDWMHLAPAAQAEAHRAIVRDLLGRAVDGALPEVVAHKAARTERWRTRARLALATLPNRVLVGYRPPKSHRVHDVADCLVLDPRLAPVVPALRALLAGERGEGECAIALGTGERPVLELRWSGELSGRVFAGVEARVASGDWAGVEVWLAGARTPARTGDPSARTPGGDGEPLIIPAAGFAQAHPETSAAMVARAVELLAPAGRDVVELFAGAGNFTVALARVAKSVVAVESHAASVEAARANLRARGLAARVVEADADAWPVPRGAELALLDPPRAGAPGASRALAASRVGRAVYVSCDPATLARDLGELSRAGLRPTAVETFEMFPHTSHVETVVRLERRRAGS